MPEAPRPPLPEDDPAAVGEPLVSFVIATCARAVAANAGLSERFLLELYTTDAAIEAVTEQYTLAIEHGQDQVEAAVSAGGWLMEITNLALREALTGLAAGDDSPAT